MLAITVRIKALRPAPGSVLASCAPAALIGFGVGPQPLPMVGAPEVIGEPLQVRLRSFSRLKHPASAAALAARSANQPRKLLPAGAGITASARFVFGHAPSGSPSCAKDRHELATAPLDPPSAGQREIVGGRSPLVSAPPSRSEVSGIGASPLPFNASTSVYRGPSASDFCTSNS
jgi:hypothetical protein